MRDRNEQLRRSRKPALERLSRDRYFKGRGPPRRPPPRNAPPLLRPAVPAAAPLRVTFAAGAGRTPAGGTAAATSTLPDPTPTRGEAGSLTSPAAATAAVEDAAAPATSSRASLPCAIQIFLIVCKKILKNPRPACNDIMCLWL